MDILEMTPLHISSWCQTRMAHFLKSCRVFDGMLAAVYDVIYAKGVRVDEQNLLFSVMNAYVLKIYSLSLKKRSSVKLAKTDLLVSRVFDMSDSFASSVESLKTPSADAIQDSLHLD